MASSLPHMKAASQLLRTVFSSSVRPPFQVRIAMDFERIPFPSHFAAARANITGKFGNFGMSVGLLPVIGVPLPLVSYGGSNLVATMWALGIVVSVYSRRYALV